MNKIFYTLKKCTLISVNSWGIIDTFRPRLLYLLDYITLRHVFEMGLWNKHVCSVYNKVFYSILPNRRLVTFSSDARDVNIFPLSPCLNCHPSFIFLQTFLQIKILYILINFTEWNFGKFSGSTLCGGIPERPAYWIPLKYLHTIPIRDLSEYAHP